jgi:mycothiol synthase
MIFNFIGKVKIRISRPIWIEIDSLPQLEMSFPKSLGFVSIPIVPEGYILRTFKIEDLEAFRVLLQYAGFQFSSLQIQEIMSNCLPEGCFVVENSSTKELVATMMARHLSSTRYPFGGRIDWLATHPEYRGLGLGNICARSATNHLIKLGYENIWVTTDDERIPALKIFLSIGFKAVLTEATKTRWAVIHKQLNSSLT